MRKTPSRRRATSPSPDLPPDVMARRVARLSRAVRDRRALEILYGGAWRVVHPHALGETGTGRLGLLTWQTAGRTAGPQNPGEGWRMFDVARIEDAELLRATFAPRPREGAAWTAGIERPLAEVPSREAALEALADSLALPAAEPPGHASGPAPEPDRPPPASDSPVATAGTPPDPAPSAPPPAPQAETPPAPEPRAPTMARSATKPAAKPARAPTPDRAAMARLGAVLQRGATPDRMTREVQAVVDELRAAGGEDADAVRTWLETLRDGFAEGAESAAEQADDVDRSDAAAVRQSRNALAALEATRDALDAALRG
ncbi:WYL domain-containing protein [Muricoccus radiodurans]|uniref:WYL domain-containing protein n=1 Tax=Muricoccus radiodurans TaxID=2231721 RepID=UPI003CF40D3A